MVKIWERPTESKAHRRKRLDREIATERRFYTYFKPKSFDRFLVRAEDEDPDKPDDYSLYDWHMLNAAFILRVRLSTVMKKYKRNRDRIYARRNGLPSKLMNYGLTGYNVKNISSYL